MVRTLALLCFFTLCSCFKANQISKANHLEKGRGALAETEAGGAKLKAAVQADSTQSQTISATEDGSIKGTAVTIAPGTLSVSTDLFVEVGVSIQETSMLSELSLPEDVTLSAASQGVIVRPSEAVELNKPLPLRIAT